MSGLSALSDDELNQRIAEAQKKELSSISDHELDQRIKAAASKDDSFGKDVYTKTTEGLLFGTRPFVAGVGGGIGAAAAELDNPNLSLAEKIKALPDAFQKGFIGSKKEALFDEADVSKRRPGLSAGIGIGTALGTAPLFALKGLQAVEGAGTLAKLGQGIGQASKLGAAQGAAHALGHANSSGEAIESIGLGASLGAVTQLGGNVISTAAPAILSATGRGVTKMQSALTGIPEKEIQAYSSRANEIKDLMKKSSGDISQAADSVREGIMKDVQVTRQKLNNQISDALKSEAYVGRTVDGTPVLKSLEDTISKVTKTSAEFRPGEVSELKNLLDTTKKFIGKDGTISVQELQGVKEELQKIAKSSYMNGAVIFPKGEMAANAAKGAAAEAKRLMDVAVPEVAKANSQLSRLHAIENVMNKNLIKAGKPEAALLSAGSGTNPRGERLLSAIDSITGGNAADQASLLSAARTFTKPSITPIDSTGKVVGRMILGGGVGYAAGGEHGAMAGAALTSPFALKIALDAGRISRVIGTNVGVPAALSAANSASGRAAAINMSNQIGQSAIERRLQTLKGGR